MALTSSSDFNMYGFMGTLDVDVKSCVRPSAGVSSEREWRHDWLAASTSRFARTPGTSTQVATSYASISIYMSLLKSTAGWSEC